MGITNQISDVNLSYGNENYESITNDNQQIVENRSFNYKNFNINPLKLLESNPYSGTLHIENLKNINKLYENMVEAYRQTENINVYNTQIQKNSNFPSKFFQ